MFQVPARTDGGIRPYLTDIQRTATTNNQEPTTAGAAGWALDSRLSTLDGFIHIYPG